MTAPLVVPASPEQRTPLIECLREMHAQRSGALHDALETGREPEAGVWSRWSAVRLAKHLIAAWFEPERKAVEAASTRIPVRQMERLWVGAELVASLRWQLDQDIGLCHHPAQFATITRKLESAMGRWCEEVEEALGHVTWKDLSDEERRAFTSLDGEESYHVTGV